MLIGVGISRFIGPPLEQTPPQIAAADARRRAHAQPVGAARYDGRAPLSLTRKKELVPRWMDRRWAALPGQPASNFAAIARIVKTCADKGLRPVLVDQPLDMKVVGSGLDKPRRAIRAACDDLARRYGKKYGVRYVHFTKSVGIPTRDFWDMHHLFDPGARIWQSRLSDELVKMLPDADAVALADGRPGLVRRPA